MKTKGIRILDKENKIVSVTLPEILEEIVDGDLFYWSILFFEGSGLLPLDKSIVVLAEEINTSKKGYILEWNELKLLVRNFYEILNILIIGCKDKNKILRYDDDQKMYESCDIVIEMFDSCFWEVFSNDILIINKLAKKFKKVELLESNF